MPGATTVGFGDAKAAKKWSAKLFLDSEKKGYFARKFIGTTDNHVIQRLTDLEQDAGDTINYDLSVQLRQAPTYGDNKLEGKEEALRFHSDSVLIDQVRQGVSVGGRMTRKRTAHNLRQIGKDKLSDWWARFNDEAIFVYLSGARGINQDFIESTAWAGFATNSIQAPDSDHQLYPGSVTAKANLASTDKMTKAVIEKAVVKAQMMHAVDPNIASLVPVEIGGEGHYVTVMSHFQAFDMRTADTSGWLDIQKAAITAEGRANPIFKGGLGMISNCVLHQHESVIRFSDYGAGSNVAAARALFMGRQAGVIAYGGTSQGTRYDWSEEVKDHGNDPRIAAGTILGIKKARFNGKDFGVLSIDTAAANPN